MEYPKRIKTPEILFVNDDYRNQYEAVKQYENVIVVTDPPFNIGYHYGGYSDRMNEEEYFSMLAELVDDFPTVMIHYPESLYRVAIESNKTPTRVCSWVYNSNTARQHRDIAFFGITPEFKNVVQPYKNQNDKRIKARIARGCRGGRLYDWFEVNQVKNVSKAKTKHPCQMPLEVMKNIVAMLPIDSIVFDPFMGSGTTALACIELGYDFIGCEIDAEYYEIAKERINAK